MASPPHTHTHTEALSTPWPIDSPAAGQRVIVGARQGGEQRAARCEALLLIFPCRPAHRLQNGQGGRGHARHQQCHLAGLMLARQGRGRLQAKCFYTQCAFCASGVGGNAGFACGFALRKCSCRCPEACPASPGPAGTHHVIRQGTASLLLPVSSLDPRAWQNHSSHTSSLTRSRHDGLEDGRSSSLQACCLV